MAAISGQWPSTLLALDWRPIGAWSPLISPIESRMFLIDINIPGSAWAIGSTDNLELLVDAVSAWRNGMPLDDFEQQFSFMRLDSFARPLASGDVTSQQWKEVLTEDFYAPYRRLLTRIHEDDRLRTLFPTFTHGVLRLRAHPLDPSPEGAFLVASLAGDSYRIKVVGESATSHVVNSLGDLIEYLRGHSSTD